MKIFRNIILLISVSLIILDTTNLNELARTPYLIQHFFEHHTTHPKDSFFDYLYKHYLQHPVADSDADRNSDHQLPFKSSHFSHVDFSPFIIEDKPAEVVYTATFAQYTPSFTPSIISRHFDTWHPPKIG